MANLGRREAKREMGMQQKKTVELAKGQRSIIGTKGGGRRGRYWKARRQEPSRRVEESVKRKKKEWVVKEAGESGKGGASVSRVTQLVLAKEERGQL